MRAQDIMTAPAVSVSPTTPLDEVARILATKGFTAVPVVEDDRLVGLVSETDLIRERFGLHPHQAASRSEGDPRTMAKEVMTSPVEFVRPDATLTALAKSMVTGRRRTMPVVEGERVVGVVTRRDVVQTMARSDDSILEGVRRQLDVVGTPLKWLVRVQSGVVHLWGESVGRYAQEAVRIAESVPGVLRVTVSGPKRTPSTGKAAESGSTDTSTDEGSSEVGNGQSPR